MSCEGCSGKTENKDLQRAINQAKKDAEEKQISMAVYKEAGDYKLLDAFDAYRVGLGPKIVYVASQYNNATAV